MSKKKGDRRERMVRDIFEEAGFEVCYPNYSRYGNTDFYNLFDAMAIRKDEKIHMIQVKSGSARGINNFVDKCQDFIPFEHIKVEYWVYHKREGWRIIDINESGYEVVFDERELDKNMGEGAKKFKK